MTLELAYLIHPSRVLGGFQNEYVDFHYIADPWNSPLVKMREARARFAADPELNFHKALTVFPSGPDVMDNSVTVEIAREIDEEQAKSLAALIVPDEQPATIVEGVDTDSPVFTLAKLEEWKALKSQLALLLTSASQPFQKKEEIYS